MNPDGGAPRSPPREGGVLSGSTSSDPSLLERIAGKDPQALAEFYDRLAPAAFALAERILRDRPEAEDLLLATFSRVWQQADRYDPSQGSPRAWILARVRTGAIDRLRRREALRRPATPSAPLAPEAPESHGGHDTAAEERERLARTIAALPADQRQALDLAYFEGLTQTQIAQRLGEPPDTVKTRIRLGMVKLRQALPGAAS